jgi:hypothetical protein
MRVQAEGKAGRGVPPTVGSRLMALVSTAVYDTVNAFNTLYPSYAVNVNAPANTSLEDGGSRCCLSSSLHSIIWTK